MTAVGEWLKQIVMIVLLASIADMLLPTKAMQKYTRMVMGLAIIAAMLQPIVPLLKGDWADQMANAAWLETSGASDTPSSARALSTLQGVMTRQRLVDENRYADPTLRSDIEARFRCRVTTVTVSGTGTPADPLRVNIAVGGVLPTGTAAHIRAYVADLLQVTNDQVTVTGWNGGDGNGF